MKKEIGGPVPDPEQLGLVYQVVLLSVPGLDDQLELLLGVGVKSVIAISSDVLTTVAYHLVLRVKRGTLRG